MFSPDRPNSWNKNPVSWLSNYDIGGVLKQYELAHPDFKLLGPSAIDYDEEPYGEKDKCVWNDLCRLSLQNLYNHGKRKLGIVFNLDKHDKGGSHWVCLFIDIPKEEIYFFDSYGFRIHPGVNKFAKMVIKQSINSAYTKKFVRYSNDIEHQLVTDSECGTYCLYIIIELLKGVKFSKLVSKRIPDSRMLKMRKIYFTPFN